MTPDELARLRELATKATPGPWFCVGSPWLPNDCETYIIAGSNDPHGGEMIADMPDEFMAGVDGKYPDGEWTARNNVNADFIAACSPDVILKMLDMAEGKK